ncbi:hypothetical protein BKA67DRAFT_533772 [Truncatella angustata]|uniref:Uncharacterized protein n=1 Tax=Truncatella angustata TaxID=152316 RepID=A0A9P8UUN7_9PEZI|nr:uncharacterized protein BKA67DRAFT_533772 [Truncatella angustata]KAH6658646.1 hypothetical protein BKA67DRAFT_533772 [Truncatella angustata]
MTLINNLQYGLFGISTLASILRVSRIIYHYNMTNEPGFHQLLRVKFSRIFGALFVIEMIASTSINIAFCLLIQRSGLWAIHLSISITIWSMTAQCLWALSSWYTDLPAFYPLRLVVGLFASAGVLVLGAILKIQCLGNLFIIISATSYRAWIVCECITFYNYVCGHNRTTNDRMTARLRLQVWLQLMVYFLINTTLFCTIFLTSYGNPSLDSITRPIILLIISAIYTTQDLAIGILEVKRRVQNIGLNAVIAAGFPVRTISPDKVKRMVCL